MDISTRTYENRVEVDVPIPDSVAFVDGGGTVLRLAPDGAVIEPSANPVDGETRVARYAWPADANPQMAATEAARLVIASTPGPSVDHEPEQSVDTRTITVTP